MGTSRNVAFAAVSKSLKNNKVMIDTREDGIYIRLAGNESKGEAFTLEFAKAYSFDENERKLQRSNTGRYAERELLVLSKSTTDKDNRPIIEPFTKEIIALAERFGKSGQSGGSAPYTATSISQAIKKLLLFEPLCPVTGVDEEWINITELNDGRNMWQNSRCSGLFKHADGSVSYNDAIIKKTQTGSCWSGSFWLSKADYLTGNRELKIRSSQLVKSFPFTPKTFYIDVIEEEVAKDDWEMYLKDPKQLAKVWKYYQKPQ